MMQHQIHTSRIMRVIPFKQSDSLKCRHWRLIYEPCQSRDPHFDITYRIRAPRKWRNTIFHTGSNIRDILLSLSFGRSDSLKYRHWRLIYDRQPTLTCPSSGSTPLRQNFAKSVTERRKMKMLKPYLHFVNINLEENEVGVLLAQLHKDGSDNLAWSAPGGGEVHNNLDQNQGKPSTLSLYTQRRTWFKETANFFFSKKNLAPTSPSRYLPLYPDSWPPRP